MKRLFVLVFSVIFFIGFDYIGVEPYWRWIFLAIGLVALATILLVNNEEKSEKRLPMATKKRK